MPRIKKSVSLQPNPQSACGKEICKWHLKKFAGIAVAAVLMQICLGAVYGWSVFKIPLMRTEHWSEASAQLTFTLALVFLGLGTVIGGLWEGKVGPRKSRNCYRRDLRS